MTSRRWFKERHDDEISRMIFLSLVLHALVLSIIFSAPSLPPPKLTFGPVYSVHLVSFSESIMNVRDSQHILEDLRNYPLEGRSLVVKRSAESPSSAAVRRIDEKTQHSGVEKAIDDIRQKMNVSVRPSDQRSDLAQDDELNRYYTVVWSRIKSMWTLPQDIVPKGHIETIVNVRIAKNGSVTSMSFEKRSGNQYFDESALRAIRKAAPFPPLPVSVREGNIEVGVRFYPAK